MIVILVIFVVQAPAGGWFWLSSPCFWMFLILMLISLEHPQEGRRWCCSPKRLPGHVGQKTLEAAFLCDIVYIEPSGNHVCHAQLRIHIDFANFQFQLFTWPQIIASSTTRHHIVPFLFFFVARARRWMIFDLAAPAFECSWCFYHHCTWGPTFPNIMLEYRVWKRLKRTRSHIMGQTWIKSRPQQVMLCNYLSHRGFLSGCSRNETHNSKA
jgi:hypothetical protein